MIQLDSVSFTYDEADGPSLDAISLSVGKGRLVGIAGADASGRSTLFRVLNGTAPCVFPGKLTGRIAVDGKVPAECGHAALGQTVASVFDDPDAQIVSLTAEEEVAFALVQRGVPLAEVHERVGQALERVGLAGFGQRSTSSLSGGQKQRLVMASALALKPAILLVDEGTCALDPAGARHFHRIIREMVDRDRCTAIVIERDLGLLFEVADEIHVLSGGKIAVGGSRADVAQRYALLRELGLRVPAWLELCGLLRERGLLDAPLPSSEGEALSLLAALEARRVPA